MKATAPVFHTLDVVVEYDHHAPVPDIDVVPMPWILMTGVLVATGVPLKLSPKLTVLPLLARVVEALEEVVVAVTTVRAAADALCGIATDDMSRTKKITANNASVLLQALCNVNDI